MSTALRSALPASILMLAACSTVPQPPPMSARISPALLQPTADAPPRPANTDGGSNGGQMLTWSLDLLDALGQCRIRHRSLADAVRIQSTTPQEMKR